MVIPKVKRRDIVVIKIEQFLKGSNMSWFAPHIAAPPVAAEASWLASIIFYMSNLLISFV